MTRPPFLRHRMCCSASTYKKKGRGKVFLKVPALCRMSGFGEGPSHWALSQTQLKWTRCLANNSFSPHFYTYAKEASIKQSNETSALVNL
ncbi:hypothetical protein FKM82_003319 [Ascaphus truei]